MMKGNYINGFRFLCPLPIYQNVLTTVTPRQLVNIGGEKSNNNSTCSTVIFNKFGKTLRVMSNVYKLGDGVAPSLHKPFEKRGWIEWNSDIHDENEWNILWSIQRHYNRSPSYSLNTFQKINHFNGTSQMTKKDYLSRNLKRMRVDYGKIYNFYPKSYHFPMQYSDFISMTQRRSASASSPKNHSKYSIWIAKPACGRRGEDITLFTDISQLTYARPMIIQKYISNPLLIGGYKFDLRIYVLITSFCPLQIFCYNDGLCRFGTQPYDLGNLTNVYAHLTNSSINKKSDTFSANKKVIGEGCKWTIHKLIHHLQRQIDKEYNIQMMSHQKNEMKKKEDIGQNIWKKIHDVIILTVLPIVMDVEQCSHCFELFGFDVLMDENYRCWLLEVNGSPAIAIQSDVDQMVKNPMLNDLIDCIQKQNKNIKHMDLEENDDCGGFEQIFPWNANTMEANQILTDTSVNRISRAQQFKKIVITQIKKRRQNKKAQ
eukprot:637149_1